MDYNGSGLPGDPRGPSQSLHDWLSANKICPGEVRGDADKDLAQKVEELARSNHELEHFAYVAAHDLQEPLRLVASCALFLAEHYRGRFDESADQQIGYVNEAALRMQLLIHDLLTFSRLEGKGAERKQVDCNQVVKETLRDLSLAIRESGAIIQSGPLPTVWANHSHLVQVFQNLIGNAIKFRKPEQLTVSVQAEQADGYWLFSIADNGMGIALEHAETIFGVSKPRHARVVYPGNGTGLAICRKLIQYCGGRIWVESQAGVGSTFKFVLPAHNGHNSAGRDADERHGHGASA